MTGVKKPTPLEAFELNMNDARWLVRTAEVLENQRQRRMRAELREKIGAALNIPQRSWPKIDCVESDDIFVVIKPGASINREHVKDLSPLLRQSIVAACAAFEVYLADTIMKHIGRAIRTLDPLPKRFSEVKFDLATWCEIEDGYTRRGWGIRQLVVEPRVRELSSTASNQVGALLSLLGINDWAKKVNGKRKGQRIDTVADLDAITIRRNKIAHEGDRRGRSRAAISIAETRVDLEMIESIVQAIEAVVKDIAATYGRQSAAF